MLAQYFKTAADLGITNAEFEALVKVLGMLERGELIQVGNNDTSQPNGFCMSSVAAKSKCGTVGYIKGWAQFIGGDALFSSFHKRRCDLPKIVNRLFMYCDPRRHEVTTEQAGIALRNYLTRGDPLWNEVLESRIKKEC